MITVTLLSNFGVLQYDVKARSKKEAIKKAKKEADLMGYTNICVIGLGVRA